MADLSQSVERIQSRWMVGGSAQEQAPEAWRSLASQTENPDLSLLALVAQAAQVGLRPAPAKGLQPYPSLPKLELPPVPDAQRGLFRRIFLLVKPTREQSDLLLTFLAARGFTSHPSDFMPANMENLPSCYAPWEQWSERQETDLSELSAASWDDFMPSERVHALRQIRLNNPSAARDLLEEKAVELPAEQRLRAVQVLEIGLGPNDAPFLNKLLETDRSGKVKALAQSYLARLGLQQDEGEAVSELADFLELGKSGIIRRKVTVRPKKLKTSAQHKRRADLFEAVSLNGLTAALDLDPDIIIAGWQFSNQREDREFFDMVARTGSDDAIRSLMDRILESGEVQVHIIGSLLDRLTPADRWARLPAIMKQDDELMEAVLACARHRLGGLSLDVLSTSPQVKSLIAKIKEQAKSDKAGAYDHVLRPSLFILGLLADPQAASALIDTFIEAGLSRADAALLVLQLNAALPSGDIK